MDTQPFSDDEKRFVLAEAIRTSTIPLERLFQFINDGHACIAWDEMMLPRGRNLKQCKDVIEALRPSQLAQAYPFQVHSQNQSHPIPSTPIVSLKRKSLGNFEPFFSTAPAPKRRQSGDPISATRDIRPKPPTSNGSPLSMTSFPTSEPKKRGRPSKKDVERKQAEAIARGDIIPPATVMPVGYAACEDFGSGYAPILPTPTSMGAPLMHASSPSTLEEKENLGSTAGSLRERKGAQAVKTPLKQSGEIRFAANPTMNQLLEPRESPASIQKVSLFSQPVAGPRPVEAVTTAPSSISVASEATPIRSSPPVQ
ncbi:hypothetical protein PZA11_002458 [Diplocarpon coronariae]|nr:hypothetical protein JHW43_001693 [Diplocarpon mali]